MSIVLHSAKMLLHRLQRRRAPALLLVTRAPAGHTPRLRFDSCHHALEEIRGFEAYAKFRENIEPVQRQCLLQPFGETRGCGFVHQSQFAIEALESTLRIAVCRVRVCCLEFPPPRRFVPLSEIAQDVLALVPLASLHPDISENLANCRAKTLRAIEHDQQWLIERESALSELTQEAADDAPILARRLHQAEDPFLTRRRHPESNHQLIPGKRLTVEHQHQPLSIVELPILELPKLVGARSDEAPRHAGASKSKRFRHRFRRRLVIA